jgi:transposase-like protein
MEKGLAVTEPEAAPAAVETPTSRLARRYGPVVARNSERGQTPFRGTPGGWKKRRALAVALVGQGYSHAQIAELFGVTAQTMRQFLYRLRKEGEIKDTEDRLDHAIIPEALAEMERLVQAGDKDMILAVLKGRGALKNHTAGGPAAGTAQVMTNLVVKFEMPVGVAKPVLAGQVVGVPRDVEQEK